MGDEDLLEIMGNSKDVARLQKHLKKMFAGVTAIDVGEEDRIVRRSVENIYVSTSNKVTHVVPSDHSSSQP